MRKISIIVATDENWIIGKKNGLPWKLSADLKHFKALTTGHTVIMGRKTFDSIGKPLPERTNIIITRNSDFKVPDCIVVGSMEEALEASPDNDEIFVMGGAEIYKQFLPIVQTIYLTRIHHRFDGDISFPALNPADWKETRREDFDRDDKNPYRYTFLTLEKSRH